MAYNLTFAESANTVLDLVVGVNTELGGALMIMFLVVTFLMILLVFKGTGASNAELLIGGGFVMTVITILASTSGLVAFYVVFIPATITVLALVYHFATMG